MGTMPEKYEVERKTWTRKDAWVYDIYAAIESVKHLKPQTKYQIQKVEQVKNLLLQLLEHEIDP